MSRHADYIAGRNERRRSMRQFGCYALWDSPEEDVFAPQSYYDKRMEEDERAAADARARAQKGDK